MREGVKATTSTNEATKYIIPNVTTIDVPIHITGINISLSDLKIYI